MELRQQYWQDADSKDAFKCFIMQIHGLDFDEWESRGYWDDSYTPFSFFVGGKVVSSVCLYLLTAIVDGQETQLVQVSGVGTLPEFRRRGLNRELTANGLKCFAGKHDGVFLFSDDDAISFYKRCGFSEVGEVLENVSLIRRVNRPGLRKLDPDNQDDLDKILRYARERSPVSQKFAIMNERLLMFHALYTLRDCLYEIPELKCLVFFRREGSHLKFFDVVAETMPSFDDLYAYLAEEGDRSAEFHFCTDQLKLGGTERGSLQGNNLMTLAGLWRNGAPVFPFTAHA